MQTPASSSAVKLADRKHPLHLLPGLNVQQQDCVVSGVTVMCLLQLMLSSDEDSFGGFENLSKKYNTEFASNDADYDGRPHSIQVGQKGCGVFLMHLARVDKIRPVIPKVWHDIG